MSSRTTDYNYTGEQSPHVKEAFEGSKPTKAKISTTEQVETREKKVINGQEFVSVKGQLWRAYDFPTGRRDGSTSRIRIENPEWLFVRPSGAHSLIDNLGQFHYVPESFIHIVAKNAEGEELARF